MNTLTHFRLLYAIIAALTITIGYSSWPRHVPNIVEKYVDPLEGTWEDESMPNGAGGGICILTFDSKGNGEFFNKTNASRSQIWYDPVNKTITGILRESESYEMLPGNQEFVLGKSSIPTYFKRVK